MSRPPNVMAVPFAPGDRPIVLAAKRGDERAFGILFERYQRRILAAALRYTRIEEDAEDVVQQTFQKAFIHLHRFEGKASFCTWLTRIAINESLMLLRRGRTLREVRINDSGDDETATHCLEILDPGPDPEAIRLKREKTEALSAAIGELQPPLRTAIELHELAELSTEETARRMGVSVASAKARVFRGRKKLREKLRRLGIAPQGARGSTIDRRANRSGVNSVSRLR